MVNYRRLSNKEKHIKFNNMKNRCSKRYQKKNPRYKGTFMCKEWEQHKNDSFFVWLNENYYEVTGQQMDIDKDILQYGNKQYHPEYCLVVPHSVNAFYESIEVGKTNIKNNSQTGRFTVNVRDMEKKICVDNIDTYNQALDMYCDIKQKILHNKAEELKEQIPSKVYWAMKNTDIKQMNQKYYLYGREEK